MHSEAYLNSLKKSADVAMIIEVNLFQMDFGFIGNLLFAYSLITALDKDSMVSDEVCWFQLRYEDYDLFVSTAMVKVPPVALFPNCLVQQKVLSPFRNQVIHRPSCVLFVLSYDYPP